MPQFLAGNQRLGSDAFVVHPPFQRIAKLQGVVKTEKDGPHRFGIVELPESEVVLAFHPRKQWLRLSVQRLSMGLGV